MGGVFCGLGPGKRARYVHRGYLEVFAEDIPLLMLQQRSNCGSRGLEDSARSRRQQVGSSACADNCSQREGKHEAVSGKVFLVAFLRCISLAFALDCNRRGCHGDCERSRGLFAAHLRRSKPSRGESNRGAAANFEAGRVAKARRMHHAAGLGMHMFFPLLMNCFRT